MTRLRFGARGLPGVTTCLIGGGVGAGATSAVPGVSMYWLAIEDTVGPWSQASDQRGTVDPDHVPTVKGVPDTSRAGVPTTGVGSGEKGLVGVEVILAFGFYPVNSLFVMKQLNCSVGGEKK